MNAFSFSGEPLDVEALRGGLDDPACGGFVAFEGWVRDHNDGQRVRRLEYEAYEALATAEGNRIVAEALEKFPIRAASCSHRVGSLDIGDLAVWVGVSSPHRDEAFRACRYIIDEVKTRVPIWKKEHYVDGDSGWVNCERCHEHGQSHGSTDYSRQVVLPQVGVDGQKRLHDAHVLVVGAGGLGCPVLAYLTAAGVGRLTVVDGDRLEASNLHRQVLYDAADVGQSKASLAAARLRRMNPDVTLNAVCDHFTARNAAALIAACDVVVDCTDDFRTKLLINDAAMLADKPAVFSSIYQLEGQLQVVEPAAGTACLRCIWPDAACGAGAATCAEAGVLGPVPGVFGSLQAVEVLKLLLDLPGRDSGVTTLMDLVNGRVSRLAAARNGACTGAAGCTRIRSLEQAPDDSELEVGFDSIETARAAGYTIVDVRNPDETAAEPIGGRVVTMPLPVFDPSALDAAGAPYLAVCASGRRSLLAARAAAGTRRVVSLAGGIARLRQTARSNA